MSESSAQRERAQARPVCDGSELLTVAWNLVGRASPESPGQSIEIIANRFVIGRRSDCDLHLSNATVSGQHAELLTINGQLFLKDLESRNGTFLNGRRIEAAALLDAGDILHFGSAMYTLNAAGSGQAPLTQELDGTEIAVAQVLFQHLMKNNLINPHYQPIVRFRDLQVVGYEALARSTLVGLKSPADMFRVAAQHAAEVELAQKCRTVAVEVLAESQLPDAMNCYLNTHPNEVDPDEMVQSLASLRESYPDRMMTVEIHESAVASAEFLRPLQIHLKELNICLAYDDFGSGQTRIVELMECPPDVVKFDIQFVRGLQQASEQRLNSTKALVTLVRNLGALTLAEGVETEEESEICRDIGFDLAQGFLFGRPVAAAELQLTESPSQ